MFTTPSTLVRLAAALTLFAAFAVTPSTADAGNFKFKGNHKHHVHFRHNPAPLALQVRHFHRRHIHQPVFVKSYFGNVVAVPVGNGFIYVVK